MRLADGARNAGVRGSRDDRDVVGSDRVASIRGVRSSRLRVVSESLAAMVVGEDLAKECSTVDSFNSWTGGLVARLLEGSTHVAPSGGSSTTTGPSSVTTRVTWDPNLKREKKPFTPRPLCFLLPLLLSFTPPPSHYSHNGFHRLRL